jgi:hypothetical protein
MSEKISLKELHDAGRSQGLEAAVSLVGLGHQETLARIADLREALARRKAALAGAGFALDEIQAWEDGYIAGLLERGGMAGLFGSGRDAGAEIGPRPAPKQRGPVAFTPSLFSGPTARQHMGRVGHLEDPVSTSGAHGMNEGSALWVSAEP